MLEIVEPEAPKPAVGLLETEAFENADCRHVARIAEGASIQKRAEVGIVEVGKAIFAPRIPDPEGEVREDR
jgi:hypothetical protein